jgi:hypothetical protein
MKPPFRLLAKAESNVVLAAVCATLVRFNAATARDPSASI